MTKHDHQVAHTALINIFQGHTKELQDLREALADTDLSVGKLAEQMAWVLQAVGQLDQGLGAVISTLEKNTGDHRTQSGLYLPGS